MTPLAKDENNCIQSGSVIIAGVEHLVQNRFIKCDAGLNARAWNTTKKKETCLECFKPIVKRSMFGEQLELF